MMWLPIFKHLLPHAKAWRLVIDRALRQFFVGLSDAPEDAQAYQDGVWLDYRPQSTSKLDAWEDQFALMRSGLSEQERRDRLSGTWKALGGQDPRYLQDTLQAAGFEVFVHEWWEPTGGTVAGGSVDGDVVPVVRNPLLVINNGQATFVTECGEALAECGEALAECGETSDPVGYPLVNKITSSVRNLTVLAGEALAECGETLAECGEFDGFTTTQREYDIPVDTGLWPFFLYIGDEAYPDPATLPAGRRDEFEALCLKICPAEQWLGIIVQYT